MKITEFSPQIKANTEKQLSTACTRFEALLSELRKKELDKDLVNSINREIEFLNSISESSKLLKNQIKKKQYTILKLVQKKANLIAKHANRNLWLALGMSIFGLPMGMVFGLALDNLAFLGIGLPIGMVIGMAIGIQMDNKAKDEGRQLDFEPNTN